MAKKKAETLPVKTAPESPPQLPTKAERQMATEVLERSEKRKFAKLKVVEEDGKNVIKHEHAIPAVGAAQWVHAAATGDPTFASAILMQLASVARKGQDLSTKDLNATAALFQGIAPRDETEALLAAQMTAIHLATMTAARRLNHTETIEQQDSASNMLNKLARTFATQVETLKKYRSTGEQSIRVQHVTVNDGGQAIVGDVIPGGANAKKSDQPDGPSGAYERSPEVLRQIEAVATKMQGPGGEGLECVPMPRSQGRGA